MIDVKLSGKIARALALSAVLVSAGCGTESEPALPQRPDPSQVAAMLSNADANEFLYSISTYEWDDDGARAAELFQWIPSSATSADAQSAQLAGEAAHAIAAFFVDRNQQLLDMSSGLFGRDHTTVGARNPELVRSFADALAPFQGALVCDDRNARGFDLFEPCGDALLPAQSVFTVIGTDAEAAGTFCDAARARIRSYVQTFADTGLDSPDIYPAAQGLTHAGSLLGLLAVTAAKHDGLPPIDIEREATEVRYTIATAVLARHSDSNVPAWFFADGSLMTPEEVQQKLGEAAYREYSSALIHLLRQNNLETFVDHNVIDQFETVAGNS
ncbi:hypothetical protein [Mycolicibacterium goodii]|uniref:DUF4856 domain-containing protein n=1 Tax=Mycolicibacterium goodii TaxID=134601 RepID=A0A0K0X6H2_MYCGD|nr:hypothetical protein AFA91_15040 [Mycolicibacterium goodii]